MSQPEPAHTTRSGLAFVVATTTISIILWHLLLLDMGVFLPQMATTYHNYNMKLPDYTGWTLTLSDWAAAHPSLVLAGFLLLLIVDIGLVYLLWRESPDVCQLWSGMLCLTTLVSAAAVLVSSLLPVVKLLQGLSR